MKFEHINFDQRKIINNQITRFKATAVDIGNLLGLDPSSVSKEVKRNRVIAKEAPSNVTNTICKKTLRFPYVCNSCSDMYHCRYKQYRYEAKAAQQKADYNLVAPRRGINLTKEEFDVLDRKIKDGVLNKQSIYHIIKSNEELPVSVSTVYRLINDYLLTTSKMDLPYACTYKKRKKQIKEYEYHENRKIDRSNRTFIDYLAFINDRSNTFTTQMDFLGSIRSDSNSILSLIIVELHFVILFIVENKNASKVNHLFDHLETSLGTVPFRKVFPVILTDRDPSFSDFQALEYSCDSGEERTRLFYCDAFKSNQKATVENINKQLRQFFPKKQSVDSYTNDDMKVHMMSINSRKVPSLSGFSPNEAFAKLYGQSMLDKLYK
ncbi:MAG: IS30 family transposase [Erysipelotrichaceae bacterium]|nr:IS30 family transposase [Erysipelotrichaceae bacterium]